LTVKQVILLFFLFCVGIAGVAEVASGAELQRAGGAAVPGFLTPGHWAEVSFSAVNRGDSDVVLDHIARFEQGDEVQYVTRFWVPAGAVREGLQPVRCPTPPRGTDLNNLASYDLQIALLDRRGQVRGRQTGTMRFEARADATMVMLGDTQTPQTGRWVSGSRVATGRTKRMTYLRVESFPDRGLGLGAVQELVVADDSAALTPGQLDALRDWVIAGGTLWLMLDRVPEALPAQLLGDAWTVTPLGVNQLSDAVLRSASATSQRAFEYPIEAIWVDPGDYRVLATVGEGYPAVLSRPVGLGRVMVTTVSASAWLSADDELEAVARVVAGELLQAGESAAFEEAALDAVASRQVGYEVLGRGWVVVGLGVYLAVLLGGGLWLARRQQLERLTYVAVGAAAVITLGFFAMGVMSRSAVPPTEAGSPLVSVEPALGRELMTAELSVYTPGAVTGDVEARGGMLVWPEGTAETDVDPRMVWTDIDTHHWENLTLPPGAVRRIHVRQASDVTAAPATLSLSDAGLELGTPAGLADVVLAAPTGQLLPQPRDSSAAADGSRAWLAAGANVVANDRYIRAGTLSIDQQRRLELYRGLFRGFPESRTVVAGWRGRPELHWTLPMEVTHQHDALALMPVMLSRPEPGTSVSVPAPLMRFELVSRRGLGIKTIYNAAAREWIGEVTQGVTLLFAWRPPAELLPMDLTSLTLGLDIVAPGRSVEVGAVRGNRVVAMQTRQGLTSPVTLRLDATQQPALAFEPDGSVLVAVRVGELDAATSPTPWRINRVTAALQGTVVSKDKP